MHHRKSKTRWRWSILAAVVTFGGGFASIAGAASAQDWQPAGFWGADAEVREVLSKLHRGLLPDAGDNLLAEVWDVESGTITLEAIRAGEYEPFDPQLHGNPKRWMLKYIPSEMAEEWTRTPFDIVEASPVHLVVVFLYRARMVSLRLDRAPTGLQLVSLTFAQVFC